MIHGLEAAVIALVCSNNSVLCGFVAQVALWEGLAFLQESMTFEKTGLRQIRMLGKV